MKGTNALAREMISLGVGKIVIYKMMLAYRYVNGEAEQIEYAVRKDPVLVSRSACQEGFQNGCI